MSNSSLVVRTVSITSIGFPISSSKFGPIIINGSVYEEGNGYKVDKYAIFASNMEEYKDIISAVPGNVCLMFLFNSISQCSYLENSSEIQRILL